MRYEAYSFDYDPAANLYWFISRTPDGNNPVAKIVRFQQTAFPKRFNLAMASIIDGKADYRHESKNKDLDKILATLAGIVKDFINKSPSVEIYVAGNTPAKARLYRMRIAKNISVIRRAYNVYGTDAKGGMFRNFMKEGTYVAFLISKK